MLYFLLFFLLFLVFSVIAIIFFRYTTEIATFIGDPKLVKSFRWLALAILFITVTSLLRRIFQGHQQMHAIAYSQISEQLVRVVIIITAAIFTFYGYLHIYDIGVFGVIASIGGALAAIIILLIFLKNTPLTQAGTNEYRSEEHTSELQSRGHLVCRLLLEKKKNKHNKQVNFR